MNNIKKLEIKRGDLEMKREEMMEALEQYYEAAGFKEIRVGKLEEMNESELEELYLTTFGVDSENGDKLIF